MKTEWLVLWVHFLWSGIFTMICCFVAWWKVGLVTQATREQTQTRTESTAVRRRLLNIACMTSVCLILNVIAALSTSAKLNEWSRTANMSLACEIKETWNTRSWDAYGFDDDTIVEVCSAENAISKTQNTCVDSCTWHPGIITERLVCSSVDSNGILLTLEQAFAHNLTSEQAFADSLLPALCDCPCDSLIEIQKPR
jgi:hypothetical protein